MGDGQLIERKPNWEIILAQELRKPRLFEWGVSDCCLFVGDIIKAMTGTDPAQTFRHKYSTSKSAFKELRKQGFNGVGELAHKMARKYGYKTVDVNFAQKGDVVCAFFDGRESLGVMDGQYGVFVGSAGYVYIEKYDLINAWAVR